MAKDLGHYPGYSWVWVGVRLGWQWGNRGYAPATPTSEVAVVGYGWGTSGTQITTADERRAL